jgi:ABC-type transporter MlaC component
MKKAGLAALALAAALVVAGTALATTPAQYRQQATAICKTTGAKLKKVKNPASMKDFGRFLKEATPIFQTQYSALRKLTPPASLKFLHGKALAAEQQQLVAIHAWIKQLDAGADPQKTYNVMDKKLSPISDAETAAWKKLRIPACQNLG